MGKIVCILLICFTFEASAQSWEVIETIGESEARGENSLVAVDKKVYLLGSRGIKALEVYDTKTNVWSKRGKPPIEMHHFQAVNYKGEVYILGALTGPFPHETPIPTVYIYTPETDKWRVGPEIPRKRGSAGCFVYKGKIYLVGGIIDGHWDGHVSWFDEFDPKTAQWSVLPDAPHARDHVSVAVIKNKVVVAAGRRSSHKTGEVMSLVVPYTDVYDFKTNAWVTVPGQDIPTMRAGPGVARLGSKVVFMGGEGPAQKVAHNEVEAFDIRTMRWSKLPQLLRGRHGTGAAKVGKKIYISSGIGNAGGGPELKSLECYGCE